MDIAYGALSRRQSGVDPPDTDVNLPFTTPQVPGLNINANYGPQMTRIGIAFICLSAVTVVLRFISRKYAEIKIGTDDKLIVAAAVRSGISRP